jgi:hypothetical protein
MLPSRLRAVPGPLGADVAVRLHRRMADVLIAAAAITDGLPRRVKGG